MEIHGLQLDIVWENETANHAKVRTMIEMAKPQPGSFVVLPEMFASGFSMNVTAIHDTDSHETQNFLAQTAADYRIYLLGGLVTKDTNGRGRNECVVYAPDGREIARYCKLHPFTLGSEAEHYNAGDEIRVFNCEEFTIAPFICYDLRFPEIFRAAVRRGANLYTVIASWPVTREDHWVTLLKARAIENQAYVIGVNRCGSDPKFNYSGRSLIFDPGGRALAEAGGDECWISAEVKIETLLDYRRTLPFLKDLRSDFLFDDR